MLPTPTKAEIRAETDILVTTYLARGGAIHYDLTAAQKHARRNDGVADFNPAEWDRNARAEFAKEDAEYYLAGDNAQAGYGISATGIRIRPRRREDA